MKITFLGAAREVTGSRTLLNCGGKNILVDYGMEQGRDVYVNEELTVKPSDIDCILLTHAHIDHAGMLPWLTKNGFNGTIWCTDPTADLCEIMLKDSAHIQETEAEWKNRKARRSGKEEVEPVYSMEDAMNTLKLIKHAPYGVKFKALDGVEVRFQDAGHLLGSASIEAWATENSQTKKLVFSGDIGNMNRPILRDPQYVDSADYVIMESTYGDRSHGEAPDFIKELTDILKTTFDRGGTVVIPAFAVGRTQEFLYFLRIILEKKLVKGHESFPVYVDSPLANEATKIFHENVADCCDADTSELLRKGINPLRFEELHRSVTTEESKALNFNTEPKVILSASGMCEAGRIRHHLKHNLWRREATILFVGYQSNGTLGRQILEGAKTIKLFGESIEVNAEIRNFNGVSGHADDKGLIKWAAALKQKPQRVFVNHGDDDAATTMTQRLKAELGYEAVAPYNGDEWDLLADKQTIHGDRELIKRHSKEQHSGQKSTQHKQAHSGNAATLKLENAMRRLENIINRSTNLPKNELEKLERQIIEICDKFQA